MARTKSDLVNQVLENLGVLAVGQTAEVENTSRVDARISGILSTLRAREVFYLGDADNIPDEAFEPLSNVVSWECRSMFGVTGDELVPLKQANDDAIAGLKIMSRGRPTYQPLRTEFF